MTNITEPGSREYDDLWSRPGYLIRRLHQIHIGLFSEECAGRDLTAVQYAILTTLYRSTGMDQLSLSMAVGIDRTSGADVIKRLIRRGLATREPSAEDRRAKIVTITEEGRELVREMRPAMERAQNMLLAPLTPDERRFFISIVRRLIDANNDASRAPMA